MNSILRGRLTTALAVTALSTTLVACGTVTSAPQPAAPVQAPASTVQRGVQYADSDILLKQKVSQLQHDRLDPGCEPATLDRVVSDHVREQLQQACLDRSAFQERWSQPRKGGGVPTFE